MRWSLATALVAITLSGCLNLRRQYRDSDAAVADAAVDAAADRTNDGLPSDGPVDGNTPRYPVEVSAGNGHTCARLSDDSIWCWGRGPGQIQRSPSLLDSVDDPSSVLSIQVGMGNELRRCLRRADSFECWADQAQEFSEPGIVELSVGADFQCTRSDSGDVRCLGSNTFGQIGSPPSSSTNDLLQVTGGAQSVSAGFTHQCIVFPDGSVGCQGSNVSGESNPDSSSQTVPRSVVLSAMGTAPRTVACGFNFSCALTLESGVDCWGTRTSGQLGPDPGRGPNWVPGTAAFKEIDAGQAHVCALDGEAHLWCWGQNDSGQLGFELGNTQNQDTPRLVAEIGEVDSFSAGADHTCAITLDGGLFCWGSNAAGQLGIDSDVLLFDLPRQVVFPPQ